MTMTEGISGVQIIILIVSGLGAIAWGLATLVLVWLRSDIRNLAESITSLRNEHGALQRTCDQTFGALKAKGVIKHEDFGSNWDFNSRDIPPNRR